jgi:hypothetical protein
MRLLGSGAITQEVTLGKPIGLIHGADHGILDQSEQAVKLPALQSRNHLPLRSMVPL